MSFPCRHVILEVGERTTLTFAGTAADPGRDADAGDHHLNPVKTGMPVLCADARS